MTTDPRLELDHITVLARTLPEGIAHVEERLGVTLPFGGMHPLMGTHNALMRLGPREFLEVIAIDPEAESPARPRWFGLDEWTGEPRLAVYVLQTRALAAHLAGNLSMAGEPIEASRGDLSWTLSVAPNGRPAYDGAFPSLIEWPGQAHAADRMADLGCRLTAFTIEHPEAATIDALLRPAFEDARVSFVTGPQVRLSARFDTPSGERWLD